jgi:uncharacterized membrane protein YfcA
VETAFIAIVAAFASLLTFFSGFGLGSLLLPAFILFYPVDVAVTLTAIVHLCNGLFKFGLMRRSVDIPVAVHFGVPAILFALAGAALLGYLAAFPIHVQYKLLGYNLSTSPLRVVMGILLVVFAIVELVPVKKAARTSKVWLWTGGALSGFFGGLSGHQGALRSAFLVRAGFSKEVFIATGVLIAVCIDITRLPVYISTLDFTTLRNAGVQLMIVTLAAFAGALAGKSLLPKVTYRAIQYLVAVALMLIGILLATGII